MLRGYNSCSGCLRPAVRVENEQRLLWTLFPRLLRVFLARIPHQGMMPKAIVRSLMAYDRRKHLLVWWNRLSSNLPLWTSCGCGAPGVSK